MEMKAAQVKDWERGFIEDIFGELNKIYVANTTKLKAIRSMLEFNEMIGSEWKARKDSDIKSHRESARRDFAFHFGKWRTDWMWMLCAVASLSRRVPRSNQKLLIVALSPALSIYDSSPTRRPNAQRFSIFRALPSGDLTSRTTITQTEKPKQTYVEWSIKSCSQSPHIASLATLETQFFPLAHQREFLSCEFL